MQRTYGKKKTDEAGVVAAAPLSPPKKKKSVWAGFVGLKRRPAFCASSSSSSSSVSGAAALSDDGEDEEEEQAFLDSELTYCEYCRMRYSRGIAADETLHRRHCKRFRFGEKWPSGLKEVGSVVRNYPDGTRVVYVAEVDNMKDDSAPKRVMEVVDLELGFADGDAPGEGFVLICNKLAVGAIIAVPVTRAFRVDSEHTTDAIVHCSSTPVPVKLGVSRIWVHRDHRRKKYGERLLDCLAEHSHVPKDGIAFSQPTQLGRKLAVKWFGREDFLIFKE